MNPYPNTNSKNFAIGSSDMKVRKDRRNETKMIYVK
jgi:hypothetical protein